MHNALQVHMDGQWVDPLDSLCLGAWLKTAGIRRSMLAYRSWNGVASTTIAWDAARSRSSGIGVLSFARPTS